MNASGLLPAATLVASSSHVRFSHTYRHYAEDVTYSLAELRAVSGEDNSSLLTLLKTLHPDEWSNFVDRMEVVYKGGRKVISGSGPSCSADIDLSLAGLESPFVASEPIPELRLQLGEGQSDPKPTEASSKHASSRSLARARWSRLQSAISRGGVNEFSAPPLIKRASSAFTSETQSDDADPSFQPERSGPAMHVQSISSQEAAELQRWASDRSQVLSRTVRGVMRYGDALRVLARLEGVREDAIELLVRQKFEYVLTCQLYGRLRTSDKAADRWKADGIDELRRAFAANLRVAYVEGDPSKPSSSFYSVLLGVDPLSGEDVVLYKVRLPGNPILGEGKPENQNHAIIFTRGEYLQTLDMNQDNYMGESFKMRNLLECFRGNVRIVGFREHIFSEAGGAVAGFAAANEFVFGTVVQRFTTWPLRVRFHYGHPDVWDKVWALSSGGVSKASKTLHVSEDIFGGVNVVLRGGDVDYVEFITVGKGRDVTFSAISNFETKITAGNAMQILSRDFSRMGKNCDLFRLLSLFNSSSGAFLSSGLLLFALYTFVFAQLLLAMTRLELISNGDDATFDILPTTGMAAAYSADWFLALSFVNLWPLFLEMSATLGVLSALYQIFVEIVLGTQQPKTHPT